MKKVILGIFPFMLSIGLEAQPSAPDTSLPEELPKCVKFVDTNNDDIISYSEARIIFDQYRDNEHKHLKNDIVDDVESAVIELISYLEGIDCKDIKKSIAAKRFIEVYYNNKFIKLDENNPNVGFKPNKVDTATIPLNDAEPQKEQTYFFDNYFSVSTQLITLYQTPLNFSNNKVSDDFDLPKNWKNETMVIFDLPIEFKPWNNAVINVTPEFAGGSAVGGAVGMGGYVNSLYGQSMPKPYIFRAQFSQLFESKKENAFIKSLKILAGQIALLDVFDYNSFACDPYNDFLNYNHMMPAAFDVASTVFGYTYGAGFKLDFKNSQLNIGLATVNKEPSGPVSDLNIKEGHSLNLQYVQRFKIGEKSGSIRGLGFINTAFSGKYSDYFIDTVTSETYIPDSLKAYNNKIGFAVDGDLAFNDNFGVFARYSWNDGKTETMHFTEADQSIAFGLVYNLGRIKRPNDKLGLAASINGISKDHQVYLENGGSGFMLGDGSLNYRKEMAFEFFYNINLFKYATIGLNYQYIVNAGYNFDKGNANFLGCRLNFSF